jgi:hypothetical protein
MQQRVPGNAGGLFGSIGFDNIPFTTAWFIPQDSSRSISEKSRLNRTSGGHAKSTKMTDLGHFTC